MHRFSAALILTCTALSACQEGGSSNADGGTLSRTGTCFDQLLNQDETDVDCGGSCAGCANAATTETVPIHAVIVSDDDGSRPCPITPAEIRTWVDKANDIWASAHVSFQFDAEGDCCSTLRSTLFNNVNDDNDANWAAVKAVGDQAAAQHPDKLVVFFRYGPGASPTGHGFSWFDFSFVTAPGRGSLVCGTENLGLLAHEIGHYLSLRHTFATIFNSAQDATNALAQHNGDVSVFEGDGLTDTAPDPFVNESQYQCNPGPTITLSSWTLPIPRDNIMSYYEPRTTLSPMQITQARWGLSARRRNGMAPISNRVAITPKEVELLTISAQNHVEYTQQEMSGFGAGWSGARHFFVRFQTDGSITLDVQVPETGRYELSLYATRAPDFRRVKLSVDDQPAGIFDGWAPIVAPSGRIALGTYSLSAGTHRLTVAAAGQNPSSTGNAIGLDCLDITATR